VKYDENQQPIISGSINILDDDIFRDKVRNMTYNEIMLLDYNEISLLIPRYATLDKDNKPNKGKVKIDIIYVLYRDYSLDI